MTCEHISKVLDKVNNLIRKSNDTDSGLYRKLGSIADKEDIETYLDGGFWSGYNARTSYKTYNFPYIYQSALYDDLSAIFDELKSCNCRGNLASQFSREFDNLSSNSKDKHNNLVDEWNELKDKYNSLVEKYNNLSNNSSNEYNSLRDKYNDLVDKFNNLSKDSVRDYNALKDKYNKLVDDYNDKKSDFEEYKEKYDETNEKLHSEKLRNSNHAANERVGRAEEKANERVERTKLEEKLESSNAQNIDLRNRLTDSEKRVLLLENKLDEKSNQVIILRLESGEKDSRIRETESKLGRKNREIERLKKQGGLSQEELLTEKLRSEKGNLELLANELKIGSEQIHGLTKYHERLLVACKNHNQANIDIHEENIARVKEELTDQEISVVHIQEICRKCERIAELRWELEQMQQEYQAHQEQPTF